MWTVLVPPWAGYQWEREDHWPNESAEGFIELYVWTLPDNPVDRQDYISATERYPMPADENPWWPNFTASMAGTVEDD